MGYLCMTVSNLFYCDNYRRGIHSAIFSFIGAMGFLASAVLPPDAYQVGLMNNFHTRHRIQILLIT
jgi:hypothetical protein